MPEMVQAVQQGGAHSLGTGRTQQRSELLDLGVDRVGESGVIAHDPRL